MPRQVLVLTYYFPPSGGPGVQRVLKFVKYLPSFDWNPVVVTVQDGAYPARDPSLGDDVPPSAQVFRTGSWDPYQLYARLTGRSSDEAVVQGSVEGREATWTETLARWVRANVFLPDARVGWVPFAVVRGRHILREQDVDAIVTTGPPHSTHLAGAILQWMTGTPWLADFRDPWTDINYYQELPHTWWAQRLDSLLERMVLRRAEAVTTVSPGWRDLLAGKVENRPRDTFRVVHNGYDEADVGRDPSAVDEDVFALTHVGSLYASRNPMGLWRALRQLRDEDAVPKLRVRLVGMVDPNVREALQDHGLADIEEWVGYRPHEEAVAYMQRAGLLLLSIEEFPAATGMLTGKLYEYLASGRPVLGVGPAAGDAADLLNETDGGRLFARTDVNGMAEYIQRHYDAWEDGMPEPGAAADRVSTYRRRAQTEQLSSILDEVSDSTSNALDPSPDGTAGAAEEETS